MGKYGKWGNFFLELFVSAQCNEAGEIFARVVVDIWVAWKSSRMLFQLKTKFKRLLSSCGILKYFSRSTALRGWSCNAKRGTLNWTGFSAFHAIFFVFPWKAIRILSFKSFLSLSHDDQWQLAFCCFLLEMARSGINLISLGDIAGDFTEAESKRRWCCSISTAKDFLAFLSVCVEILFWRLKPFTFTLSADFR